MGLVERVAPARMGASFRWLLGSAWTSNLGDGIALAAGPLLVARLAGSPFLVALAAALQWLPPLVLGLVAGVVTDRFDRRRVVVITGLVRVAVLGVLVAAILTDAVGIGLVLVALFAFGVAEVFGDSAEATLLPAVVDRDDLAVGNARLMGGFVTMQNLVGPPLGALLFAAGTALPFVAQALLLLAGAILITRIVLPPRPPRAPARPHREIGEALRWTWAHPNIRTLVLTILLFNVTYGAAWSVLVLYARERLGLGAIGYGAITAVIAAGGIAATLGYGALTRRVSLATLMRVGLVVETATHLALALTTTPWVAYIVFALFGAHAFVWGTTSVTVRQRAVPQELQGRVNSVNTVATFGGLVVGAGIGGALAEGFGVVAPFWFAFVGSAVLVIVLWPQLAHIAHADAGAAQAAR
ncbi:MFS transporter [Amnibacterium kyonggiense]|uniref:Putative MFS family arabinose efflux permease n=1 Tax=Amnibacterium kyonggiense TaxID=595671 RepID=A0A4V3EAE7_9MICO|nr:MFS transporter [Amnibacterium kyonggiense]TDS76078.1 putative MFS family arabinose efflux permease [Amnibacterium kyonggiense]